MNPESSKVKVSSNKECNSSKGHMEENAPFLIKTTNDKEREAELGGVEKGQPAFNLQKELEKVKIPIPLIELLKQPTYKAQVS